MDWEKVSEDRLDRLITESERGVARLRAVQMAAISEKRRRKSYQEDGCRSLVDWVVARADVSHETARKIRWTGSRLAEAPEVAEHLATGEVTFDRAEQVVRLPESHRSGHNRFDVGQLKRLVAHHRRIPPKREKRISENGFLNFQVSSDETTTKVWGELPGLDARMVEKAVDQRADEVIGARSKTECRRTAGSGPGGHLSGLPS